jgi:phage tail protein X
MSTFTTTTLAGDTLDALCWRELGTTAGGVVEQAFALNRALAAYGAFLPGGIDVVLPVPTATQVLAAQTVNLWD